MVQGHGEWISFLKRSEREEAKTPPHGRAGGTKRDVKQTRWLHGQEHLLGKREELVQIFRTHIKMAVHSCDPTVGRCQRQADHRGLLASRYS